jgi:tetratricopeptide (TPR) repeat protein
MNKLVRGLTIIVVGLFLLLLAACKERSTAPSKEEISEINLKRGNVVLCGPADEQFGTVQFITSCSPKTKKDFDLAIALLHSFEYDEAEKVFAKVIEEEPTCAMAYWGVAMSNYHQVWPSPPTEAELKKGSKAILIAQALKNKSKKETDYIDAMALFYKDWNTIDHRSRTLFFEKEMEKLYASYPTDKEVAVFYALSLVGAADPADKTYTKQRKAGNILTALYPNEPNHPGIVHYIIHTYDYPELASLALPAARKYASIAPSSAHAQHMPSHIFTRLGLWAESIQSNLISTSSARCYAETAGIKGHWDEELHGMDYLMYAYLQRGENDLAKQQCDYLKTIKEVYPANFKVAYAFAAIPSRYYLENKLWKEAAGMEMHPLDFPWQKFPWQKAIIHFTRLMGAVHTNKLDAAKTELKNLDSMRQLLMAEKDMYKANQVLIQLKTGEGWILFKEGKTNEALQMLAMAVELEDKTGKSPVTPGEIIPARECMADMLLQMNKPTDALAAYEANLKTHPNRFNALYGAALASEISGDKEKAKYYYSQLLTITISPSSNRTEIEKAKLFLKKDIIAMRK